MSETDFGWHVDPTYGAFRVSFKESDLWGGIVYVYLPKAQGDVILARNVVIGQVSDAFAGWSEEDRDLAWFRGRLKGMLLDTDNHRV